MQDLFVRRIQQIVVSTLDKMGLNVNEWQLGKVGSINANGTLNVFINGSLTATPSIPCNPDVTFEIGDSVWVHFVNRKHNNLFIPYKRMIVPV
jgi:hypothetical protein